MSDSTTTRPRPRPKPKPKPKIQDVPQMSATPGEGSGSSSTIPQVSSNPITRSLVIEIDDSDDMFIRNKNRTFEEWQILEKINKEVNKCRKEVSSDSDGDGHSPSKRKHAKKKQETMHIPLWQKHKQMTRLLSEDLSEDSDIEILGESSTPNGKSNGKRKRRKRSRSRSITPPPALPQDQIMNAKAVVRKALQLPVRAPSPTFDNDADESTDTIIFQPELNAIANELMREQSVLSHTHSTPAPEAGNEDNILLTVKFKPHPLSPQGNQPDQEFQYKIDRTDAFRDLFEAVAEDASIQPENLILTYLGKRFFPSVTPQILKIWSDSADLVAYEKTTYEYIHKNPVVLHYTSSQAPAASTSGTNPIEGPSTKAIEIETDSDDSNSDILGAAGLGHKDTLPSPSPPPSRTQFQTQSHESDAEAEGETFKLILRSALTQKDITLTVRPTTKCGAIVKAFLKKAGLADQYPGAGSDEPPAPPAPVPPPKKKGGRKSKATLAAEAAALAVASALPAKDPRLCIEGDKMDNGTPIGEQDVEDGDMIEVVGL